MKLIRFHATADGGSRFEDVEVPMGEPRESAAGGRITQSVAFASPAIRLVNLPAALDQSWHHAPARQIVVVLSGAVEVMTTDNQRRRANAGEAFIADDLTGKGHCTRVVDGPATVMFVELPPGFDVARWSAAG